MPAFLAAMTAGISGFSSRGARKIRSTPWAIMRVDVGDLLGGRTGSVGIDELVAELRGFGLHALRLGDAPGIVGLRLREADLVLVLLLQLGQVLRRHAAKSQAKGSHTRRKCKESSSQHRLPP